MGLSDFSLAPEDPPAMARKSLRPTRAMFLQEKGSSPWKNIHEDIIFLMTMIMLTLTLRSMPSILSVWLGPVSPEMTLMRVGTNLTASCSTVERRPPSSLASRLSLLSSASMLLLRSPLGEDPNLRENSSAE